MPFEEFLKTMPESQRHLTENIVLTVYNFVLEVGGSEAEKTILDWLKVNDEREGCFRAYPRIKERYKELKNNE